MKQHCLNQVLQGKTCIPQRDSGFAFAPTNIAVCKYWGKRDEMLNLPVTSSLSVTLGAKGTYTRIARVDAAEDVMIVNGQRVRRESDVVVRLQKFLDLFRATPGTRFRVETESAIPMAAGLASSASGFASVVKALDDLFGWQLDAVSLSILARLGSGSACRSLWNGFVEWQAGERDDGKDSHGVPLTDNWPALRIGLCLIATQPKVLSSRAAMQRTVATSPRYREWSARVSRDLRALKRAIAQHDFHCFAQTAEANALAMHETMQDAVPSIVYSSRETLAAREKIWALRDAATPVYFTQDAGPNLKLLFLSEHTDAVRAAFPESEIIAPFSDPREEQVILVDENDNECGVAEKMEAHRTGKLHRAFSVFLFRRRDRKCEVLLQQRHAGKYHSGGLWTNTCCSHPRPGEETMAAAHRRLKDEMGIHTTLSRAGTFRYFARLPQGLCEHELDHVFVGTIDDSSFQVNHHEVQDYRWIELLTLQRDLVANPAKYTPWFAQALTQSKKMLPPLVC